MADDRPLPEPTADQFLQEYERYRNQRLILHHNDLDKRTQPMHPRYTLTRLVEADLIPVNDRAGQQLAKRCADLYDSFLASATAGTNNTAATDTNNPLNRITTATITPATTPRPPTTPQRSPAAQTPELPEPHPQTTLTPLTPGPSPTPRPQHPPPPLLHITPTQLYEYTTALHNLLTPTRAHHPPDHTNSPPTAEQKRALAEQDQALAHQKQALAAREAAVGRREGAVTERAMAAMQREKAVTEREKAVMERERAVREKEAAAVLLFDEALLARQLREVWMGGFERGLGQGLGLEQTQREGGERGVVVVGGGDGGGFASGSGGGGYGDGMGDGAGNGHRNRVVALRSYLDIMQGVLAQVRKARTLAGCPPPAAEQQLETLEVELVRLVDEGRAVMAGTITAPGPAAPGPAHHAHVWACGDGRQNWAGSEGPHGPEKGKERMVLPSGNEGVDILDGAVLLMALKKKATMLGLFGPAGENRLGEGGSTTAAVNEGAPGQRDW
ncbi:hypothetical protein F5144DRAFT_632528 [Chaetomium tenue]|uniref:Uncharacterized protein n=1 Tax=Chaetomium tenue TaxID=1854479 RepID=A0ACB7NXK6_9PEZI|nr:hypothetical protein F5144DRAFT_632528 [Chaetomium globosum]